MNSDAGQMTWRPDGASSTDMLYLRSGDLEPWQPYTHFPEIALPDPPGFSIGYATFLALLKKEWQAV
ncbi:hypothetical protein [Lusitaniella coriacea]|uniref:hypothetical protein n=1 Tax=Lusitaniella coriacea TaxID=1983105 RepID=UPI003CED58BF